MKIITYLLVVVCIGLLEIFVPIQTNAQDEFEKVQVLDHPRYSLTHRFLVDAEFSFLPLDAYYKPIMLEVATSYQFSDWFSWEIARFGYAIYNYDTGLNNAIQAKIQQEANDPSIRTVTSTDLKNTKFKASSTAFLNLLYSKSNWFNQLVVYHYWQAGVGFSYYDLDQHKQLSMDLVLRARFFLNKHFMLNLRGGHSFGFSSKAPRNISFLGLGGGFAF